MTKPLHELSTLVTGKLTKPGAEPTSEPIKLVYQRVAKNKGNLGNIGKYGYQLRHETPRNDRKSASQLSGREKLKAATQAWQGLSMSERETWKTKASRLHITGYNLFCSQHMRGEISING